MIKRLVSYIIAFLTGFVLMGYEILGVRVLSPYYGGSVYVWGAIIAVILTGLSAGYVVGGKIADRGAASGTLAGIILAPAILIILFPFYGHAGVGFVYNCEMNSRLGALSSAALLFLLPYIFIGAVMPVLVRMLTSAGQGIGSAAGNVGASSTFGSIAGTLITSFFLISRLSVSHGIILMGVILFACGIAAAFFYYFTVLADN